MVDESGMFIIQMGAAWDAYHYVITSKHDSYIQYVESESGLNVTIIYKEPCFT